MTLLQTVGGEDYLMVEDLVLLDRGRFVIRICACFLRSYLRDEDDDADSYGDEVDDEVDGLLFRFMVVVCCVVEPLLESWLL